MIIGIQRGLDNIKLCLEQKGYKVVEAENYDKPIDAIVYETCSIQDFHITENNMRKVNTEGRTNYGVFLVNSKGRDIKEIDAMLKNRCYSSLF